MNGSKVIDVTSLLLNIFNQSITSGLPLDLAGAEKGILRYIMSGVAVDKTILALFVFLKEGMTTSASAATPKLGTMPFGSDFSKKNVARRASKCLQHWCTSLQGWIRSSLSIP